MKVRQLLAALLLALPGCEAVNETGPDGQDFTLGIACLPDPVPSPEASAVSAKRAAPPDSSGLRVLFVPVTLNCGLKYAFSASLPAPEIGGTTAKCMCRKELTVSMRAESGQSLDQVKVLKTSSGVFADFH